MDLQKKFKDEGKKNLMTALGLKNAHEVPEIEKVIVAMGIGSQVTRKNLKDFSEFERNLTAITGQKPRIIHAKKSVSNFKLREGMPVMMQVTLRKSIAYDFLWRLTTLVLPRVRDFSGLDPHNFDDRGNFNLGIKNYALFPEIGVEDVTIPMGVQVTIVPTVQDATKTTALLKELGFIFKSK